MSAMTSSDRAGSSRFQLSPGGRATVYPLQTLTLRLLERPQDDPALLAITSVDGVPVFAMLPLMHFDASGAATLSVVVPLLTPSMDLSFRGFTWRAAAGLVATIDEVVLVR
jgi:hypothetical protein